MLLISLAHYFSWLKREDYNEDAAIRKIKEYCELMVNDVS